MNIKLMKIIAYLFFGIILQSMYCQTSKTYLLTIGMQHIDAKAYQTRYKKTFSDDATSGVPNDIEKMKKIAQRNGHDHIELTDKEATVTAIKNTIETIAKKVRNGDTFIFYFSGHGDVLPDKNGDEKTGFDQALVAYDDFLVDDEIYELLNKYFKKTNNVMIVDACHSSTTYKYAHFFLDFKIGKAKALKYANEEKAMKAESGQEEVFENSGTCNLGKNEDIHEAFNLIYLGATEDENTAQGNINGGLLTVCMDNVITMALASGAWKNYTYARMACEVAKRMMQKSQNLQYHEIGISVDKYAEKTPFKTLQI